MRLRNPLVPSLLTVLVFGLVSTVSPAKAKVPPHKEEEDGPDKTSTEKLVRANNSFTVKFYRHLAGEAGDDNLFVSPFSVSSAISMTYAGARGETASQIESVLGFQMPPRKVHRAFSTLNDKVLAADENAPYQLNTANALWGQEGYEFLKRFIQVTREFYGAGLRRVDYRTASGRESARRTINKWISNKTQGKIEELIGRGVFGNLTRLVLTNAIYFKGSWKSPFDEEDTSEAPFTLPDGSRVETDMMYQESKFRYGKLQNGAKLLEMLYEGDDLSMVVLLPREADGLDKLEESLSRKTLANWLDSARSQKVKVYLPSFEMKWKSDLSGALKALGMEDAFSLPPADFSGMTGEKDLFISNVIHEAYVKVDEEGTEATAATGVVVGTTSVEPRPHIFRADHPFMFCIRHRKSGAILFAGRVMDPTE